MGERILVIGAGGFIGRHLVAELLASTAADDLAGDAGLDEIVDHFIDDDLRLARR